MKMRVHLFLGIFLIIASGSAFVHRPPRSLPSVSDDHYSELSSDGTYRYAYTGENRYHAEKRLADGTVEGETLYIRPDGIPIKVHYFADAKGYRPKTEVLYAEKLVRNAEPALVLAPPPPHPSTTVVEVPVPVPVSYSTPTDGSINAKVEGNSINIGSLRNGEDVAIASPSVTAIVGPGGRAELRPEAYASTRSSGGISISSPSSTAIVGPGGSVVLAPTARASTGAQLVENETILVPPPAESIHTNINYPPVLRTTYAVPKTPDVLIVPAKPSYEYTYSYSAPDSKHPHKDNSAFVNVRVNS